MTDFSAEKLRALDEQHRTRLITTLRNWQREMERSCDALRELGPDMEDAAMGNAHVAEALEEAADAILAMAERQKRLEGDVQLWKRIANERSEQMQQLNLDRAAMGVENMQLREALQSCSECDPESAMFAAAALDPRSDLPAQNIAIEAGKVVLEGRGTGLYSEAEDAIRLLIAAFPETKP